MASLYIDLTGYALVLVLDTQVILEGRPLKELPWSELSAEGPILLLCTPRMLSEVDSKKRDGRVGERARAFNRLATNAVAAEQPTLVCEGPPRVDIALIATDLIDWESIPDLDKDEGDDRIVAETLFARVSDRSKLTMFSYDLRPRAAATRHGLAVIRPPESWIYEPEPSPQEKENLRLRQRLGQLEATQPDVSGELILEFEPPPQLVRIAEPAADFKEALEAEILSRNPRRVPRAFEMLTDHTYSGRYDEYEDKVREYANNLRSSVERLFNQFSIIVAFGVGGSIGAAHIDVQIRTTNGRLHDKLVLGGVFHPPAPHYRPGAFPFYNGPTIENLIAKVARHEVVFDPKPDRQDWIRLACEDFRHGRTLEQRCYIEFQPRAPGPAELRLSITAENLRGTFEQEIRVPFEVENVELAELIDVRENRLLRAYPLQTFVQQLDKEAFQEETEV